ncbi:unnamed protein product [Bursaphelenchus okinawaensis]|uniref:DUF148 domain-containing protein n=1 Tax=Bursaphelenchus okinawaensis TaxID=465554 RepID=A0A811L6G7_9BILA|nr:unnamed protein product [Bursaphelenchus okinawaensis]CAG9119038.1 unnamed protein product [Bursaphelenchus okinawaensis]
MGRFLAVTVFLSVFAQLSFASEYEQLVPGLTDIALKLQGEYNRGWSKANKAIMHRVIASVGVPSNETAENLVANMTMFHTYLDLMEEALNQTEASEQIKTLIMTVERSGPQMMALSAAGDNATAEEKKEFSVAFTPAILIFEEMDKEAREDILDKVPALRGVLTDNETRHAIRMMAEVHDDGEAHKDAHDVNQMSETAKDFMHQLIMNPEKVHAPQEDSEEQ